MLLLKYRDNLVQRCRYKLQDTCFVFTYAMPFVSYLPLIGVFSAFIILLINIIVITSVGISNKGTCSWLILNEFKYKTTVVNGLNNGSNGWIQLKRQKGVPLQPVMLYREMTSTLIYGRTLTWKEAIPAYRTHMTRNKHSKSGL